MQKRIQEGMVLERVKDQIQMPDSVKASIWQKIQSRAPLFDFGALKGLSASEEAHLSIREKILARISATAESLKARKQHHGLKWVAAFALFIFSIQVGPQFFLAPQTIATSTVNLIPTFGDVSYSIAGYWQPLSGEMQLQAGSLLRTREGEASILFHDNAVVRLAPNTTVEIHDITARNQAGSDGPTLTLYRGQIWAQGLIPGHHRPLTIKTVYGTVAVHEGSVAIAEDSDVRIEVFDRSIFALSSDDEAHLVAGEYLHLSEGTPLSVKKFGDELYDESWVVQNLGRDAVHRRSIAQLQQERMAAKAGILPTSKFYPVKRIAETVDVLFAFSEEAKVQKQLEHASVRLDEATALMAQGEVEAVEVSLLDYKNSLLEVATGSGEGSLVDFLIKQTLAEDASELAATLPDEDAYLIKKVVMEVSAEVPNGEIEYADVQSVLLLDTLSALLRQVDNQEYAEINTIWTDLESYLAVLDNEQSALRPEARKEAKVLLSEFAFAVDDIEEQTGDVNDLVLDRVREYLPPEAEPTVAILTEEEVQFIVQNIRSRIFVYNMARSRLNQLNAEFKALAGHPDQGRILRRLYHALPWGPENFPEKVRGEIVRLQWQRAADLL